MKSAYVLMTAMPPTTGHLQLIQFANRLAPRTIVIVCTQPHEPMTRERVKSIEQAVRNRHLTGVTIAAYTKTIEQNPAAPGFWDTWKAIMESHGITPNDYIVASEPYGQQLAEITGAQFFPYDVTRDINAAKATPVRNDPYAHFTDILPEFRPFLRTTVTLFGAESTGKTTLSKRLANNLGGTWLFEYARPYLELTVNEITQRSMTAIWHGQAALQRQAKDISESPYIIQDTDLYSTVGYWQFPQWQETIGSCPAGLKKDAQALTSDVYLITKSNIPFEQDPLRYGGDTREGSDEYWIAICEQYHLPYIVLDAADIEDREAQAIHAIEQVAKIKRSALSYDRHGL